MGLEFRYKIILVLITALTIVTSCSKQRKLNKLGLFIEKKLEQGETRYISERISFKHINEEAKNWPVGAQGYVRSHLFDLQNKQIINMALYAQSDLLEFVNHYQSDGQSHLVFILYNNGYFNLIDLVVKPTFGQKFTIKDIYSYMHGSSTFELFKLKRKYAKSDDEELVFYNNNLLYAVQSYNETDYEDSWNILTSINPRFKDSNEVYIFKILNAIALDKTIEIEGLVADYLEKHSELEPRSTAYFQMLLANLTEDDELFERAHQGLKPFIGDDYDFYTVDAEADSTINY